MPIRNKRSQRIGINLPIPLVAELDALQIRLGKKDRSALIRDLLRPAIRKYKLRSSVDVKNGRPTLP